MKTITTLLVLFMFGNAFAQITDPGIITAGNPSVCAATSANITGTSAVSKSGSLTYTWQISSDSTNWYDIPGSQNLASPALASKTYFRRLCTDVIYSGSDTSNVVAINVLPTITPSIELVQSANTICKGGKVLFVPYEGTGVGPNSAIRYFDSNGDFSTNNFQSSFSLIKSDTFYVTIKSNVACVYPDSVTSQGYPVKVSTPYLQQSGLGLTLNPDGNIPTSVSWHRNDTLLADTGLSIYALRDGSYKAEMNGSLCDDSVSFQFKAISFNSNGQLSVPYLNGASYQWFYNGTLIPNATDTSYLATQLGVYTVQVVFNTSNLRVNARSEGIDQGIYSYNVTVLGLDDNAVSSSTSTYPNPFVNELHINASAGITSAVLKDGTGVQVLERPFGNAPSALISTGLDQLHSGIYFLELQLGNGTKAYQKLVKAE